MMSDARIVIPRFDDPIQQHPWAQCAGTRLRSRRLEIEIDGDATTYEIVSVLDSNDARLVELRRVRED